MKKKRALLFYIGMYILIYSIFILYDYIKEPFDGIVAGWRYHRLMVVLLSVGLLLLLLVRGFTSRNIAKQNIALSVSTLLFLFVLLEVVSWGVIKAGWFPTTQPKHHLLNDARDLRFPRRPFWGDFDSDIAFWRLPQDTITVKACHGENVFYKTNAYGARDRERTEKSTTGKRVVVMGDSFMEGFMVDTRQRASDRLEQKTGREHLNFGILGTSPINYYLTYKHLGSKFEHDAVVIGVLPANDFEDYNERGKVSLIQTPIYRPYWNLKATPYQLKYSLDDVSLSAYSLEQYRNPGNIHHTIDHVFGELSPVKKVHAVFMDNSYTYHLLKGVRMQQFIKPKKNYSRYNEHSEEEWKVFAHSLEKLFEAAAGKRVLLVMYPILSDIKAYDATKKNQLNDKVKALCDRYQVSYIDLLPYFHAYEGDWQDLYVPCDGHWSERGEKYVSEILYNHPLYQKLLDE